MRFIFADSVDTIDPAYDFVADRTARDAPSIVTTNIPTNFSIKPPTTESWFRAGLSETPGIRGNTPRRN